jgi:predicted phosphodiesterase
MKRILWLSDPHGGHRVGLTPPSWQYPLDHAMSKVAELQRALWDFFTRSVDKYKPYDAVIVVGDVTDGSGARSGGTELLTTDGNKQAEIAAEIIRYAECPEIFMVRGTPYHCTIGGTSLEDTVASMVEAREIKDIGWYTVNGKTFKVRHKIGTSVIPHGRATPVLREVMWNVINAELEIESKADVLVYGHAHYDLEVKHMNRTGIILPGLQGLGTTFGGQQCSGYINFGIRVCEIADNGEITWKTEILKGIVQKPTPTVL